ncbi:MAG: cell envelope biogenesis protein OmpA [Thermodesulfobacteriota bacterium]
MYLRQLAILIILFSLTACATQRPVLYPNNHLKAVGEAQAKQDIDDCILQAEHYVKTHPEAKIAESTAKGGVTGAVVGGAVGAVTGNFGRGLGAGAAGGAAFGFMRGLFKSAKPSPVQKEFINRCLREKGYEPIGWE